MAKQTSLAALNDETDVPSVAVLVLTYNQEDFIQPCLESLVALNYAALKIWVLDDGSTDATAARAREFARTAPKEIHLIEQDNSGGHISGNLQTLLESSEGEYILFMSGDDMLGPAFPLEKTVRALEGDPRIALMLARAVPFAADPTMRMQNIYRPDLLQLLNAGDARQLLEQHLYVQVSRLNLQGMVVRRTVTERMGGFDTDLIADDYAFFMRVFGEMVSTGMRFCFDPDALWLYRLHGANVHRVTRRQFTLVAEVVAKYVPADRWRAFRWDTMGMDSLQDWEWARQKTAELFGAEHAPQITRRFANASIKAARRRRDRNALLAFASMNYLTFRQRAHAAVSLVPAWFG
ncbi:glycosyltransferase family 2 protein [uncultured Roseobacter sp.]|uniref:glycosyltransferase n=1 Tax=uncultured Roseobacter sp. TaxID=114847 RepID=UPI002602EFA0|nr:glycosyltransferase family A protein [uncultured Roseobacter sp.]